MYFSDLAIDTRTWSEAEEDHRLDRQDGLTPGVSAPNMTRCNEQVSRTILSFTGHRPQRMGGFNPDNPYTFDLLQAHAHHIGIVVVIGPSKTETVRYLERYQNRFEMAFVYQKPSLMDATGAVLSARSWFGDRNIVLLPDQSIFPSPALGDPIGAAFAALTQSSFCFIATLEDSPERVAEDGALRVVALPAGGHQVVDFADKPGLPAAGFNAVWAGFGFRREQAQDSLTIMYQSACREPITRTVYEHSPLHGCPAVLVAGYEDLGTWPRIQRFWASNGEKK